MKKIKLGFSPCPNDTYIFDAMVNGRIDTGKYSFEPVLRDVEELNLMAGEGVLDITKISVAAYADVSKHYMILDAGSALGKGVGPLLVSRGQMVDLTSPKTTVATPGKHTTANLLLSIFFPHLQHKTEFLFSDIDKKVLSGDTDTGLLIHEGRFTFQQKGLVKLVDLGELWEEKMRIPLPLGCIGASRKMPVEDRIAISHLIKKSIEYARQYPDEGRSYIKNHSQEMADEVIEQHINLYVNDFSLTLGPQGMRAIEFLLRKGAEAGVLPKAEEPLFNESL